MSAVSGTETPALSDAAISERLLDFLKSELGAPSLAYSEPPRRLTGGYDTTIFAFALEGAPPEYAGPLILRVLQPAYPPERALMEKSVHNTLTGLGYPAPRVPFATADTSVLGAAFLIMERIPGKPLLEAQPLNIPRALAQTHVKLHSLPAPATLTGAPQDTLTVQGYLARLNNTVTSSLPGLRAGMGWLFANVPESSDETVICHGDFHPMNILSDGKQVTGVIDWPNAILGPPQYDVAQTLVIARFTSPTEVSLLERVLLLLRPVLARRYLSIYRKLSGRELAGLETYEAMACMRCLVDVGIRANHNLGPGAWNRGALLLRFKQVTGITATLPGGDR